MNVISELRSLRKFKAVKILPTKTMNNGRTDELPHGYPGEGVLCS